MRQLNQRAEGESKRQAYVDGVRFVESGHVLHLAHHDDKRRDTAEEGITGALVILPGSEQVGKPLLEELAIDLNGVGHGDRFAGGDRMQMVFSSQAVMMEQQAMLRWWERGWLQPGVGS